MSDLMFRGPPIRPFFFEKSNWSEKIKFDLILKDKFNVKKKKKKDEIKIAFHFAVTVEMLCNKLR